jgi:hypothetical protein
MEIDRQRISEAIGLQVGSPVSYSVVAPLPATRGVERETSQTHLHQAI